MKNSRLLIFGASGFVGSALCERLHFTGEWDFIPVIHSSGNAARLARLSLANSLVQVDLLKPETFFHLLNEDCIVINCSRGSEVLMRRGFRNLLLAAHSRRVRKLIHLSSLAIFGEDPPEETADPSSRAFDRLSAYGQLKRWQDDQVFRMHRKGLQSYIICPGNITGPYSRYSVGLFARIRRGPVPLVDEGCYPTNLVHVDNVVEALLTVASSDRGAGRRYFVNEVLPITWKDYIRDFAECARLPLKTIPVCRDEVLDVMSDGEKCAGISEQIRILLSGEFRQALSVVPFIARLNKAALSLFENFPMDWQRSIRARFGRPINVAKIHFGPDLTEAWVRVQVRRVFHSPNSLVETFGWRPAVDYRKGLQLTAKWLQFVDYGEWKQ